jgi:hypothetical protein
MRAATSGTSADDPDSAEASDIDSELLVGRIDAPRWLAGEMASLLAFQTSTLTAIGYQRNGVWGEGTSAQKIEHLGLMFGAPAASAQATISMMPNTAAQ